MFVEKIVSFEEKKDFSEHVETVACSRKCGKEDVNKKCRRDADTFRKCRKNPSNAGDLEGLRKRRTWI